MKTTISTTSTSTKGIETMKNNIETQNTQITKPGIKQRRKQAGASVMDFIFWMGLAAIVVAGVVALASSGKGKLKVGTTVSDVVEMKQAAETYSGGFGISTSVSLAEVCKAGYGYSKASWCSQNPFGGTYEIKKSATRGNAVDITIKAVDGESMMALGNALAPASFDRCKSYSDVGGTSGSGTCKTVTVPTATAGSTGDVVVTL